MKNLFISLTLSLFAVNFLAAQDCPDTIRLQMDTTFDGTDLLVHVSTDGFADLISAQGSIRYDADVFRLKDVSSPLPQFGPSSWSDDDAGTLLVLWYESSLNPVTLPDGTDFLTLRFEVLQPSATSYIGFTSKSFGLEFSNSRFELLCVSTTVIRASGNGYTLAGRIVSDRNQNCTAETDETGIPSWIVRIDGNGKTYYRTTDAEGRYSVIVPEGSYLVTALPNSALWNLCVSERTFNTRTQQGTELDFLAQAEEACYRIKTEISTPHVFLTPCAAHTYTLVYENQGTQAADDAYLEVAFDEDMSFVSAAHPDFSLSGNVLTLPLGRLEPGGKGSIALVFALSCKKRNNEAVCLTARAFPFLPCDPLPGWGGAILEVEASCDAADGKVSFAIRNAGAGPMSTARSYIVTEDDVLSPPQPVQLGAGEELRIEFPADGTTYRLTADQDKGFPFATPFVTKALEGCTTVDGAPFSTGFTMQFEESDRDPFIDTECREVRLFGERVVIVGNPKGYDSFHKYITKETQLEYTIAFFHTGKDTVSQVLVKNRIPDLLDAATLQLGAASHPYRYRINQERELIIEFDSIALAGTDINAAGAGGFIEYSIYPVVGAKDGDIIYNDADVIFDLEERVSAAAREKHTIGTNFVVGTLEWTGSQRSVRVWPNPAAEQVIIDGLSDGEGADYELWTRAGSLVERGHLTDGSAGVAVSRLPGGSYLLRLRFADSSRASVEIIK